jgi:hypothetical protein
MATEQAAMQLVTDEHLRSVLEFMWGNVPSENVLGVAEAIPQMARLLWATDPQEPFVPIRLEVDPAVKLSACNQSLEAATESSLEKGCVGGDSVAAMTCR